MIRRTVAVSAVAVLTLGTVPAAVAAPGGTTPGDAPATVEPAEVGPAPEPAPVLSLGEGPGRELYVVQLEDEAVPSYTGGVKGLAPVQTRGRTFSPEAAREEAYRDHLVDEQADVRQDIAAVTGSAPEVPFTYTDALNGMAVSLTRDEAREVAGLDGVVSVQVDEVLQPQTDVGPAWIGAPSVWDGTATTSGTGTRGEGIVIGVLDTGINPANPSFAATVAEEDGGDAYVVQNTRDGYYGVCDEGAAVFIAGWGCNDKLIGAWDFVAADGPNPYDSSGHGTHTASTAAGNQVDAKTTSADGFTATSTIQGVAPHANVIAYDVCAPAPEGCPSSSVVAGLNQAIADGVDVLNYSLGSATPSDPWNDADAEAFLNARAAGIHVAASVGNRGPGAATVGSPGDLPWLTSVASTSHNRQWQASVEDISADRGETYDDIPGVAFAHGTDGTFRLVDAADLGSNRCVDDALAGQDLSGMIVVCETGTNGRVEKGDVVEELGAEGMILMNGSILGDSLNAEAHVLPAVHITYADGVELEAWMDTVEDPQASLSGAEREVDADVADVLAASSGRGPNPAVDIISPSLSAPGVDVLAADGTNNKKRWGFRSGTSMASPHVAGALALIAATRPDWSPAEAQSALMTTASTGVTEADDSAADWFGMGSGRVDLTRAADAGLVLDETEDDYLGADPALGGDVSDLNLASMADSRCWSTCTWTRTVTATDTGVGTWSAEGAGVTDGLTVQVEPESFDLAEGESKELTITAEVFGGSSDDYRFGTVTLTPPEGSAAPAAHLPVAAASAAAFWAAGSVDIQTRQDTGSQVSGPIEPLAGDPEVALSGLVPATVETLTLRQDDADADPYDRSRTEFIRVTVPEGATRLVANVTSATAHNVDLFVGRGATPRAATEVAARVTSGPAESIDLPIGGGGAGQWWILVQSREGSTPTASDLIDLEHAVVAGDSGNFSAEPAGQGSIRTEWDDRSMRAGQTWYGAVTLTDSTSGAPLGILPVTLTRLDDLITVGRVRDARQPRSNGLFVLQRPGYALGESLTVTYRVSGTARAGRDYRRLDGVATFRAGARTTREVVRVVNRPGRQAPTVVRVDLTSGTGYTAGRPGATRVVIRDARRR